MHIIVFSGCTTRCRRLRWVQRVGCGITCAAGVLQCVAPVLQCVAPVLQCVAVCCASHSASHLTHIYYTLSRGNRGGFVYALHSRTFIRTVYFIDTYDSCSCSNHSGHLALAFTSHLPVSSTIIHSRTLIGTIYFIHTHDIFACSSHVIASIQITYTSYIREHSFVPPSPVSHSCICPTHCNTQLCCSVLQCVAVCCSVLHYRIHAYASFPSSNHLPQAFRSHVQPSHTNIHSCH